jgi:hypothetical protein
MENTVTALRESGLVQFPRLLDEILAVGLDRDQMDAIQESMGCDLPAIANIFADATETFERSKELSFHPKAVKWVLQMENELDSFWVKNATDPSQVMEIPSSIPLALRQTLARSIWFVLNTQPTD